LQNQKAPELRRIKLRLAAIFAAASAALAGAAFIYYAHHRAHLLADAGELLRATAVLKSDEISAWRNGRLGRTAALLDTPILSIYLKKLAADPGDRETASLLKKRLETFILHSQFDSAYLTDAAGRIKVSAGDAMKELCRPAADMVKNAPVKPVIGDLHHSPGGKKHGLHIAALAAKADSGARLYLVLTVKPEDYLYPLIKKWPGPSQSGETLLLRREGEEVVFLNDLRHSPDTALKLRLSMKTDLPAAMAARGITGIVQGTDYRGKKVLAYLSSLPEFGWYMVTKLDTEEVFAHGKATEFLLLLAVLLSMAVLGGGAYAVFESQNREFSRELGKISAERMRALQDFEAVFRNSADGKSITSIDGTVRPNQAFCELVGYTEEELRNKNWRDITPEEDIPGIEQILKDLLEGRDRARFEKRYIRKDGVIIWGEVSVAVHRTADGKPEYFITSVTDVTRRKKTEGALRERDAIFSAFMEHSPIYVFFKDEELRSLHLSRNFEQMLGRPLPELLGKNMFELFPSDFAKAMVEADRRIMLEGKPVKMLEEFNGRKYTTTKFPIQLEGKPALLAGYTIDITEQERAAEALRSSEAALREAQRLAKMGNWTLDLATNRLEWSEEIFRIFEITPDKFGASYEAFLDAIHPEDRAAVNKAYADSLKNGSRYEITHRLLMKDGRVKHVTECCETELDEAGKPLKSVGTVQDVTERLEALEALRKSEQRLRSLWDHMAEGVALHELVRGPYGKPENYRIVETNPQYGPILGLDASAVAGKLATEAYGTGEAPFLDRYAAVAASGRPDSMEIYFDPLEKHFSISIAPWGKDGFATIFSDVTARKKAELETERLNRELTEKNKEMENFLYVTTHDLRSPLVNIQGFSRNLSGYLEEFRSACGRVSGLPETEHTRVSEILTEKAPEALGFILDSSRKMDALITALLRVSRAGRLELRPERLDMNSLLKDVLDAMRFQADSCGAAITVEDLPPCRADAGAVNRIFSNLLDNALKHAQPGVKPEIRVNGRREGAMAVYTVEDNGPGIPPEDLPRVWEIFYRPAEPSRGRGEGIGLPLIKRLALRSGGEAAAAAASGGGAVFTIKLPAA